MKFFIILLVFVINTLFYLGLYSNFLPWTGEALLMIFLMGVMNFFTEKIVCNMENSALLILWGLITVIGAYALIIRFAIIWLFAGESAWWWIIVIPASLMTFWLSVPRVKMTTNSVLYVEEDN
jgi:hypothetical protein